MALVPDQKFIVQRSITFSLQVEFLEVMAMWLLDY